MQIEVFSLNLISPLYYNPEENSDPFGYKEGEGEKLYCFKLDEQRAFEFEPDKTKLLDIPVFSGVAAGESGGDFTLPSGHYLFAQKREILSRDDIIDMAAEIQQEGLWQRLRLGEKLFLRYLFEDGCCVTQLFRPFKTAQLPPCNG